MALANELCENNPKAYKKCRKKLYDIHVCMPPIGTVVINKLEQHDTVQMLGGRVYFTVSELTDMKTKNPNNFNLIAQLVQAGKAYKVDEVNRFVLAGTVGELWTVKPAKLQSGYVFIESGGTIRITQETLNKRLKNGNLPWTRIQSVPDNSVAFACFIPVKYPCQISTSWGAVLNANGKGVEHGKGDFILAEANGDVPNLNNRWVVNGLVFGRTYDNHGWTDNLSSQTNVKNIEIHDLPNLMPDSKVLQVNEFNSFVNALASQYSSIERMKVCSSDGFKLQLGYHGVLSLQFGVSDDGWYVESCDFCIPRLKISCDAITKRLRGFFKVSSSSKLYKTLNEYLSMLTCASFKNILFSESIQGVICDTLDELKGVELKDIVSYYDALISEYLCTNTSEDLEILLTLMLTIITYGAGCGTDSVYKSSSPRVVNKGISSNMSNPNERNFYTRIKITFPTHSANLVIENNKISEKDLGLVCDCSDLSFLTDPSATIEKICKIFGRNPDEKQEIDAETALQVVLSSYNNVKDAFYVLDMTTKLDFAVNVEVLTEHSDSLYNLIPESYMTVLKNSNDNCVLRFIFGSVLQLAIFTKLAEDINAFKRYIGIHPVKGVMDGSRNYFGFKFMNDYSLVMDCNEDYRIEFKHGDYVLRKEVLLKKDVKEYFEIVNSILEENGIINGSLETEFSVPYKVLLPRLAGCSLYTKIKAVVDKCFSPRKPSVEECSEILNSVKLFFEHLIPEAGLHFLMSPEMSGDNSAFRCMITGDNDDKLRLIFKLDLKKEMWGINCSGKSDNRVLNRTFLISGNPDSDDDIQVYGNENLDVDLGFYVMSIFIEISKTLGVSRFRQLCNKSLLNANPFPYAHFFKLGDNGINLAKKLSKDVVDGISFVVLDFIEPIKVTLRLQDAALLITTETKSGKIATDDSFDEDTSSLYKAYKAVSDIIRTCVNKMGSDTPSVGALNHIQAINGLSLPSDVSSALKKIVSGSIVETLGYSSPDEIIELFTELVKGFEGLKISHPELQVSYPRITDSAGTDMEEISIDYELDTVQHGHIYGYAQLYDRGTWWFSNWRDGVDDEPTEYSLHDVSAVQLKAFFDDIRFE